MIDHDKSGQVALAAGIMRAMVVTPGRTQPCDELALCLLLEAFPDGLHMAAVQRHLAVAKSTCASLVTSAQEAGHIEMHDSPKDRSVRVARLSERGWWARARARSELAPRKKPKRKRKPARNNSDARGGATQAAAGAERKALIARAVEAEFKLCGIVDSDALRERYSDQRGSIITPLLTELGFTREGPGRWIR